MAALSLNPEQCKCDNISLPIVLTNVAVLVVSLVADLAFVLTAEEVVNSFNWSYQMLNDHLANKKIGKEYSPIYIKIIYLSDIAIFF